MWVEDDFQRLSPPAKLVLLALSTGSLSNLAGLAFYYPEALERETGLTGDAIEAAMGELEKRPTPARSFVVCDLGVVWIRDLLRSDPAREGDPEIKNQKHRTAIQSILASLPRDSAAVKKFRDAYHFRSHTPSHRPRRKASHGAPATPPEGVGHTPDSGLRIPHSGLGAEGVSDGPPGRPEGPAAHEEPKARTDLDPSEKPWRAFMAEVNKLAAQKGAR
jgi:hypothetical protein